MRLALELFPELVFHFYERVRKYVIFDVLIVFVGYMVAFWVRIDNLDGGIDFDPNKAGVSVVVIALLMISLLYAFGVYHRIWSRTSGHGITVIIYAVFAATIPIIMWTVVFRPPFFPVTVVLLGNFVSLCGFVAIRYQSRLISGLSWRWKAIWFYEFPKARTRVLIVGAGEAGQMLAMQLQHRFPNTESAYEIVGFIDDDAGKQGMYVEGCRVLGTREDIVRLADAHNIDLIVVAMHNISGTNFRQILERCETTKARIKVTPNVFALMDAKQSQSDLRDVQPEDLLGRSLVSRHETVDLSPVMGKTILITGAAGSIGSELSRQLCSYQPVKLILLDSNESNLHDLVIELSARYPKIDLTAHLGDITLRESLVPIFRQHRPQVVFHAAAYKHVPLLQTFPQEAVRVNVGGTHNVAYLACEYGVERFVLISSDKAVNPTSVMGATKRICEMLIQAISQECNYSTLFTAVRFGNVLGSRGSVVPTFMRQINSGGPVTVTDPEMTRYFMSVQEAVNLVIHAACITQGNEIFLLKMGEVVKILDLAERMIRIRGMRPYKDIEIKFTGIRPGEKLHEQLYDGSAESATETSHPGIIQLNYPDKHYRPSELLAWVDCLLQRGVDNEKALDELRWGLTPSEQYAVENL